jgi:hypothetical protein
VISPHWKRGIMTEAASNQLQRFAWIIIGIALVLKFVALFVWQVHLDTNYYLNIGSNFIEHGGLTPYMWRVPPDANIIAGSGTGYGILLQTFWLKTFGLNLISGRLQSYLAGILALVVIYLTARKLWNGRAALVTVAAASVTFTFLGLLTMRMDALGYLAYSVVLLVHVYAVYDNQRWLHLLTGVLAIASAEVHILGTVYVFGLAFYYAVDAIRVWRREGHFPWGHGALFYYVGALIAGIVYLFVRVLPDPEAYFLISQVCRFCDTGSPARELVRHIVFFIWRPIDTGLILLALWFAYRRRCPADVHYLLLVLGCALAMGAISPPQLPVYTAHLWAVSVLGIGAALTEGGRIPRWRYWAGGIAAAVALLLFAGYVIWLAVRPVDVDPRFDYVRDNVPTDTVVLGYDGYFHELLDYPLFLSSSEDFGLEVGVILRGETTADVWARERPAVLLVDPADVPSLGRYIEANGFVEVMPNLWADPQLGLPST